MKRWVLNGLGVMVCLLGCGEPPRGTPKGWFEGQSRAFDSKSLPNESRFCAGLDPKNCFTLILRIPSNDLIDDLGLSVLNLARLDEAKRFRELLLRKCALGLKAYIASWRSLTPFRLRGQYFSSVKDSRCVIQFLEDENAPLEPIPMASKALSLRLTGFSLSEKLHRHSSDAHQASFEQEAVTFQLESIRFFTKPRYLDQFGWQTPVRKNGPFGMGRGEAFKTLQAATPLRARLGFSVKKEAFDQLAHAVSNQDSGPLDSFVKAAQATLKGANPPLSLLSMIGFGVKTLVDLCDELNCHLGDNQENVTSRYQDFRGNKALKHKDYTLLADSLESLPQASMDQVFLEANLNKLRQLLNIPDTLEPPQ